MSFNGPLHEMSQTTPTSYWNDSCSVEELTYAIERGAVGATSNPVIVLNVLKKEMYLWEDHIRQVIVDHPTWNETAVAWKIFEDVAVHGAKLLLPVFEREQGRRGRLSIQTDPASYRNPQAILQQAIHFASLLPNMQVKVPATKAGLAIVEEATYLGINVNVTVNFTVPQALAVGEAVERGLKRREAEGLDNSRMSPVNTMMVGRNDDWMKVLAKRDGYEVEPECLEWAGVACFKRAYSIYQERGYRCRLLSAAYRNFYHWTEFIGGDVSLTIPHEWQVKYNSSDVKVEPRMHIPVDEKIIQQLYRIPDFRRAYEPDGMTIEEFDSFGATVRTLRSFIEAWHNFVAVIRDFMLPNPDVK
ncbi:MAG: transaldolase family protein [Anaerolineales bacterium]